MSLPLPSLQQARLDWALAEALFDDLAALTRVLEVRLKTVHEGHAELSTCDLAGARAALIEGRATGARIRYHHAGTVWCDTLVREPNGLRLVRIASPAASATGGTP